MENPKRVPESALRDKAHQMEPNDFSRHMQGRLDRRPVAAFKDMKAGKVYYDKERRNVLRVQRVTPTGRQAEIEFVGGTMGRTKVHKGSDGDRVKFVELDEDLLSYLGITHEDIVREAVNRGLEIPPRVRRHYPLLFVTLPERFAERKLGDDLRRICHRFQPPGPDDIDRWIEAAHEQLAGLFHERVKRLALNADMHQDFDRWVGQQKDDIDYYRWLRSLVAEGGVFHIPDLEPAPKEKRRPVFKPEPRPSLPLPTKDMGPCPI